MDWPLYLFLMFKRSTTVVHSEQPVRTGVRPLQVTVHRCAVVKNGCVSWSHVQSVIRFMFQIGTSTYTACKSGDVNLCLGRRFSGSFTPWNVADFAVRVLCRSRCLIHRAIYRALVGWCRWSQAALCCRPTGRMSVPKRWKRSNSRPIASDHHIDVPVAVRVTACLMFRMCCIKDGLRDRLCVAKITA